MAPNPLHLLFFPMLAQGHILPTIDMAKLFAARGVQITVLTTPGNAPQIRSSIDRANKYSGYQNSIQLSLIPFPSGASTGLPEGCENVYSVPVHLKSNFRGALSRLQPGFEQVLKDLLPDFVVTSIFYPWTYDVAAELGIPRLTFHGSNFFSQCAVYSVEHYKVLESCLTEDVDKVVLPSLPHRIEMLKSHVPNFKAVAPFLADLFVKIRESNAKSYGDIVNSFYELEPDYADYYRKVIGTRAWHVGPMCLTNDDVTDMSQRGQGAEGSDDHSTCLKWLDSMSPSSVIYVCFGSVSEFTAEQLREIALGLEASNHRFIWPVRDAIPQGFEERVEGRRRGLIVRGWAPQMLILNHVAVGGFLTHCGWNSTLEGVTAGLPLITWPLFAEQTFNERLIVDVLKIGIAVGVKECTANPEERALIKAARIGEVIDELMGEGEEAAERRRRAKELGESARKAVEIGGSSYVDTESLIQELMEKRKTVVAI